MTIYEKLAKIRETLPSLVKSENNGEWNYTPIDDFYEVVAPAIFKAGLFWTVNEVLLEPYKDDIAKFTYDFHLFEQEQSEEDGLFTRISILHPLKGAQTSGSAMSQAEKVYLRSLLKVVTGEADADALGKPRARAKFQPARQVVDDFTNVDPIPSTQPSKPADAPQAVADPEPVKSTKIVKPRKAKEEPQPTQEEVAHFESAETIHVDDDANLPVSPLSLATLLQAEILPLKSKVEVAAWSARRKTDIQHLKSNHPQHFENVQAAYQKKMKLLKEEEANAGE